METRQQDRTRVDARAALVGLLGEPRATIVRILKQEGERSAPELAEQLGITDVAVRRHLALLSDEGLLTERTVKQERGRPVTRFGLSDRARELFPHRYVEMLGELLEYVRDNDGLGGFLRWRQEREAEQYAEVVDGDDVEERLEQLVAALNDAGYEADLTEQQDGFRLTQRHCAVFDAAKDHPQICAHEAAMFRRVLGDVQVSRRETLAKGDAACVCTVTVGDGCS